MRFSMAEAAKKLGVSVSLIRRYEREFNLQFARTEQGRCELTEQDLTNLRIIRAYRSQNMPIDEIKGMLNRNALVATGGESTGPDVREVLAAIVARQDELEKVVQSQMATLQQLTEENQQLRSANERMQLLLEAPRDHGVEDLTARLDDLEARAKASEEALDASTKDEMIRKLQRRLLDLEAAVATELSDRHETDEDEGILDELARAIQEQATATPPKKWWQVWR
ncbi:MAG TPA: MerR family transcriptional regulator [Stenomitos sp.]